MANTDKQLAIDTCRCFPKNDGYRYAEQRGQR